MRYLAIIVVVAAAERGDFDLAMARVARVLRVDERVVAHRLRRRHQPTPRHHSDTERK